MNPRRWLLERAESYARDATVLRELGEIHFATLFRTLADELRKCSERVGGASPRCSCCEDGACIEWEMQKA